MASGLNGLSLWSEPFSQSTHWLVCVATMGELSAGIGLLFWKRWALWLWSLSNSVLVIYVVIFTCLWIVHGGEIPRILVFAVALNIVLLVGGFWVFTRSEIKKRFQ